MWLILQNPAKVSSLWNGPLSPNSCWASQEHVAGSRGRLHFLSTFRHWQRQPTALGWRGLSRSIQPQWEEWPLMLMSELQVTRGVRRPTWHACALPGRDINLAWPHIIHFLSTESISSPFFSSYKCLFSSVVNASALIFSQNLSWM